MLFGFKMGVLLSWSGALTGACLAYGLCRLLGREKSHGFVKKHLGYDVKDLGGELAFWSILMAELYQLYLLRQSI